MQYFSDRQGWRSWLQKHHATENHVWLVFFKKSSGKPTINYAESVEEAVCFGWIDGLKKSIDEQSYAHRFTPRKKGSKWSPANIKRARNMIAQGMMTEAGLSAYEQGTPYDSDFLLAKSSATTQLPADVLHRLKADKIAWKNFNELAPGHRKQYVVWLTTAKKPETILRRTEKAVRLLLENRKPGM